MSLFVTLEGYGVKLASYINTKTSVTRSQTKSNRVRELLGFLSSTRSCSKVQILDLALPLWLLVPCI